MTSYPKSEPAPALMQGSPPAELMPRADWDRPPWNRWAFQHVREFLPTAEVWRGSGRAKLFPQRTQDLDSLAVKDVAGLPSTLATLLEQTFTDGFLVLHKGALVYERYFNGMTARTPHLSQSVAKSFTGALAGILQAQGVINVAKPVTHYLPELTGTAYQGATLQQLLDMRSGVRFDETYTDPYSDVGQVDVASGWKPVPAGSDPAFKWPSHMFELILKLKTLDRPHGSDFSYRSIETDVAAFCLERASGVRLAELLSREIWQKAGMEENAYFTVDPAGFALADGGLNATLRDYARFGQLYLEGGGGIIPEAWVESSRRGEHWSDGAAYAASLPVGAYKNCFWIENAQSRSLVARGVFGQMIFINWDTQTVVAKLSSWPDFVNISYSIATFAAANAIGRALAG